MPTAVLITLVLHLLQQPLPDLLILPVSLLQILKNPVEIRIGLEIIPGGILRKPRIILVPQINRPPQLVQRLAGIPLNREIRSQPVRHLAVRFRRGQGVVLQ